MKFGPIATLSVHTDWLKKAEYELFQYKESCGVFDMANCFLTLNALPEWIAASDDASDELKNLAKSKIRIMKGVNFELNTDKLGELDHQLRLVRMFCNHAKHAKPKEPLSYISMSASFPISFPAKYESLSVGIQNVNAFDILQNIKTFWSNEIHNT